MVPLWNLVFSRKKDMGCHCLRCWTLRFPDLAPFFVEDSWQLHIFLSSFSPQQYSNNVGPSAQQWRGSSTVFCVFISSSSNGGNPPHTASDHMDMFYVCLPIVYLCILFVRIAKGRKERGNDHTMLVVLCKVSFRLNFGWYFPPSRLEEKRWRL